jgi:uncharacterized protein YhaN
VRFRELRLVAYGPFTDQVIDFGEPAECDLHIVLGLNEAGKSSARRAIHALLFGFPHVTPDAHVHPYERLRVGALLDTNDGQSIEFARVKARQRDLRDAADEPLDDSVLRHMLGGIDETLYDRLFLFDHEELRQGGAGLLAGGGDFGVSLFGATLGAGNLAAVRRDLHQRGEALFKSDTKARKPLLNAALNDYRNHIEKARGLSVRPREYESAAARVDELARERQAKTSEVATLEGEERTLGRMALVTGSLARRQAVVAEFETLPDLPVLAVDATTHREVALESCERVNGQLETANAALEELQKEIDPVIVPEGLLERAAEVQALVGEISKHEKALRDRDKLSRDFETKKAAAGELRSLLGRKAPENSAPVDRALQASIEKLGEEQATLLERHRVAHEQLRELTEVDKQAAQELKDAASAPDAPDAIVSWMAAAIEQVPLALAANKQKGAVERAITRLVAAAQVLSPPFDPRARASVEPPATAVIAAQQKKVTDLEKQLTGQRAERDRLALQRDQLLVQLAALGAEEVENTREQMVSARSERDQHFAHLGDHLGEGDLDGASKTHEQLGATLLQTDELADTLLAQADHVHLTAEVAEIVKQLDARENDLTIITAQSEELLTTWRELWKPCGFVPLDDANAMLSWRERYEELGAQYAELALQLTEHQEALSRSEETAISLHAALESEGSPADRDLPLEQLVEHARSIVERTQSAIAAHEQLVADARTAADELAKAQSAVQQTEKSLESWNVLWTKGLAPLAISAETTPAEARATIALLGDLADAENTTSDLTHRVESITADYDAFANSVFSLTASLAPDLEGEGIEMIRELNRRVEAAKISAATLERLEDRKRITQERIAELEGELSDANGVLSRLCKQARCGSAEELPAIENRVATRDRLHNELLELDKRIVEQGEQTVDELTQLLDGRSGDELATELAAHHESLQAAKSELELLVEEHTNAIGTLRQLDHGTEAALEREQAEHDAARIGELAERYLVERSAAILLARAIEYHREHSAQPILERAQQLLPQLTANSLTRLFVDDESGDHPVLMARRADGGELGVSGMSDGTLDQLYLALRLAALEHHLDALPPLPVLLDDILVNYDELRVAASLPAIAEIAQRTQVIVLTHHQHVATIAEATLSERVRIHHLGAV